MDEQNENNLGSCRQDPVSQTCSDLVPCATNNPPKCMTVNETPYCDEVNPDHFCKCFGPGPFVEPGDGKDITPTPTEPTSQ